MRAGLEERAVGDPGSRLRSGVVGAMSTVDLARVGACVLKHAVTGEVRPSGLRAVGAPRHLAAASESRVWAGGGGGGELGAMAGCERPWRGARGAGDGLGVWTCSRAVVWRRYLPAHTQAVELRSLWQEQACVVAGLRRFGCMVCRWIARDLSNLKGLLDQHGVRLVGVGPEALGLQEFLDGGYFTGGACATHPPPPARAPQLPNRPETPLLLRLRAFACLLLVQP